MVYHKMSDIGEQISTSMSLSIAYVSGEEDLQPIKSCYRVSSGYYSVAVFGLDANGRMKMYPEKVVLLHIKGYFLKSESKTYHCQSNIFAS